MLSGARLRGALERTEAKPFQAECARVVTLKSLLDAYVENGRIEIRRTRPDLLYAGGVSDSGGRFTPVGGPDTLYLASSESVANAEWRHGLEKIFGKDLLAEPPKVTFKSRVKLQRMVDLSDSNVLEALGTCSEELMAEWDGVTAPGSQVLGQAIYDSCRFSGIRYQSARIKRGYCLAIFPRRLIHGDEEVSILDPYSIFSQVSLAVARG
jgi:RES domain-containing protein